MYSECESHNQAIERRVERDKKDNKVERYVYSCRSKDPGGADGAELPLKGIR